jgi:N-acetyl sugar amidotransferase
MDRCTVCLYPKTKPDLAFEDGICSACRNYANRPAIDWDQRKRELVNILSDTKPNDSGYDCIVASSGGKDSHYQVLTLLELGARPLIVTATTCLRTTIGAANIANLARYATTVEITANRSVRGRLCRLGLELVGDVSWPEHASIFSVPWQAAKNFGIGLIFYGENPQAEYGGPLGSEAAADMTRRWVTEFGGFLGLRPADFIGHYGITSNDMLDYALPNDMDGTTAYFLGQFIPWDSHRNARIANEAGMWQKLPTLGSWWAFENLDNALTGLHDHGCYRKYGYGRLAAQISVDIRRRLIDRETALDMAKVHDGEFPFQYGGVTIDEQLDFLGMTSEELFDALKVHTNWPLFDGEERHRPLLKEWAAEYVDAGC